ncbi:DsbE family thiol:disulfide interchange protein [Psychrobium sp. MM17-31]|uniref:DsbE family thiol:disulfide interchange protein n=1 Tax=Psychrobium sp. MM17-31 TaxID=2917758 RepID=UPI001EF73EC3|nr:DsbE family thiol:disulfide interchange protein [Psychrobium sp. MM17-31]MCG7532589.1 DsbE family thiol:disulfide interchange protein [Psychrobium sp. MM17-31]
MKRVLLFLPLVLFLAMGFFLYRGLYLNPQEMPSALEGKPVPSFKLLTVKDQNRVVTNADLKGQVYLLNVWGTWCAGCKIEHPYLLDIAKSGLPIYGINFKDELNAAQQWLEDYEDPYQFTVYDSDGRLALDLGVYGAPETFVVDDKGIIRLRFAGILDPTAWNTKIKPLIESIKAGE